MELAKFIDHTLLKAEATKTQIDLLCAEAKQYGFATVCVEPCWVKYCVAKGVKVCTVVGFPLGVNMVKAQETELAVADGAQEIDMVINLGKLKDADYEYVQEEIAKVVKAANGKLVKVIIEACLLSQSEKVKACELAKAAGAQFVKTSTGMSTGGATIEDVKLMRQTVGPELGVKAAGGVKTRADAEALLAAGATRLGCSKSLEIIYE